MAGIEDIEFILGGPKELSADEFAEVQRLRTKYYQSIYSESVGEEIAGLTTRSSWNNPNKSSTRRSSRISPRVARAYNYAGRLVGFAYTADDASSNLPTPAKQLEQFAKHHVPMRRFQDANYLWFREVMSYDATAYELGKFDVVHGLGATLLRDVKPDRNITLYPYDHETALVAMATAWGMQHTAIDDEHVLHLPSGEMPAPMMRYQGEAGVALEAMYAQVAGLQQVIDPYNLS